MDIIRIPERPSGITQGQIDVIPFLDQIIEVLGFPGEGFLQQPEEIFGARPLVPIPELNVVPPAGGGIFYDQA